MPTITPELLQRVGVRADRSRTGRRRNGANKWADYDDGRAVSGLVNRGSPELRAMHLPERLALLAKCKTALSCAG